MVRCEGGLWPESSGVRSPTHTLSKVQRMSPRTAHLWRTGCRALFALLALLSLACSDSSSDSSADPFEIAVWTLDSEPTVTIGQVEGAPEYLFTQIGPAVLLPGGRIAVADRRDAAIRLFDPDGTFLREIGHRGEGPGEFSSIRRIVVSPPDTLVVHDSGLFRLTRFLTSGSLVSTLLLQADDGRPGDLSGGILPRRAWLRLDHPRPQGFFPDNARCDADG